MAGLSVDMLRRMRSPLVLSLEFDPLTANWTRSTFHIVKYMSNKEHFGGHDAG